MQGNERESSPEPATHNPPHMGLKGFDEPSQPLSACRRLTGQPISTRQQNKRQERFFYSLHPRRLIQAAGDPKLGKPRPGEPMRNKTIGQ